MWLGKLEVDKLEELKQISEKESEKELKLKETRTKLDTLEREIKEMEAELRGSEFKEGFGVLMYINRWGTEYSNAKILKCDDEHLYVYTYYRYRSNYHKLNLQDLLTKGYTQCDGLYFTNKVDEKSAFEIILDIIGKEREKVLEDINNYKKWIKDYQQKLKDSNKKSESFNSIKDEKILEIFKQVGRGLNSDMKKEQFMNSLPRVITLKDTEEYNGKESK